MRERFAVVAFCLFFTSIVHAASRDTAVAPEVAIGQRLFFETRFAQAFFAQSHGDVNAVNIPGDPALNDVETAGSPLDGPFKGKTMNCRQCHLESEFQNVPGAGLRIYTDFARRSPIPAREDGKTVTTRNAPTLVGASLPRPFFFQHFDGEFSTPQDLVIGGFTGRNFGWLPGEQAAAIKNIASVIRNDNGLGDLAKLYGGAYAKVFAADKSVPAQFQLPRKYRMNVRLASDAKVVACVANLVAAYMTSLDFSRDASGAYNGSPYDLFLIKNNLPRLPAANESGIDYSRRLRAAVNALANPILVSPADGTFTTHAIPFQFGADELAGLKLFLAEPPPPPAPAPAAAAARAMPPPPGPPPGQAGPPPTPPAPTGPPAPPVTPVPPAPPVTPAPPAPPVTPAPPTPPVTPAPPAPPVTPAPPVPPVPPAPPAPPVTPAPPVPPVPPVPPAPPVTPAPPIPPVTPAPPAPPTPPAPGPITPPPPTPPGVPPVVPAPPGPIGLGRGIGNCIGCHTAPQFTDFVFHNTGVSQLEYDGIFGPGAFQKLAIPTLAERTASPAASLPANGIHPNYSGAFRSIPSIDHPGQADLGLWNVFANSDYPKSQTALTSLANATFGKISQDAQLTRTVAAFKTPGLRDLGHSQPYLHNGRLDTLRDVVDFYVRVGQLARDGQLRNADPRLGGITLSPVEAMQIAKFLDALNEDFKD